MSSNPPLKGKGLEHDAEGVIIVNPRRQAVPGSTSNRNNDDTAHNDSNGSNGSNGKRHQTQQARRFFKSRSEERKLRAINDAQQGLNSLLDPRAGEEHPVIISPSGAIRNHTRGRIAGPTSISTSNSTSTARPALSAGTESAPGQRTAGETAGVEGNAAHEGRAHYIVPGAVVPAGGQGVPVPVHPDPDRDSGISAGTGLGRAVALVARQAQAVRTRAGLLINAEDYSNPGALGPALDTVGAYASRKAASQWVARYATHLVIVLVVSTLVAVGGLKTLTVRGAYGTDLHAVEAYTGTDHFEDEHDESADGSPAIDSTDFEIALPRTELGGADAVTSSVVRSPDPDRAGKVIQHTVVEGETIAGIAARYNLMPETIMGSNGIYDPEARLEAGRVLVIPPVDGMYYVAAQGDTVESIAQRFQVEPDAILSYPGNNIRDGVIAPGQPVIVPGGMMPPRQEVITYTVKPGDSLREIAARFGVDVPTLIYSNNIPDPDNLQIGVQLRVLPVPGVEYRIEKGDTIQSIAAKLGVSPQMILDYEPNHLTPDSVLQIDRVIIVPGGRPQEQVAAEARLASGGERLEPSTRGAVRPPERQPDRTQPQPPKREQSKAPTQPQTTKKTQPQPKPQASNNTPKVGSGKLMWPVRGVITQYFSARHNGLDIATRAGTPIHAADSGRVIWSGWRTDGLGYCVIIDHLNGLITAYGHMLRQPPVYVGQYVSKGQVIGYIGSTGRSTGPHVHFIVKVGGGHNYRNPLLYLGR